MDFKYKGVSKKDIEKIQRINMPRFSKPVIDYNIMKENASIINGCIDKIAEREARNQDIYIICEIAKLYLDTINREKCCGTCAYHDDFTWVCFNPEADDRADFTDENYLCDFWEENRMDNKDIEDMKNKIEQLNEENREMALKNKILNQQLEKLDKENTDLQNSHIKLYNENKDAKEGGSAFFYARRVCRMV